MSQIEPDRQSTSEPEGKAKPGPKMSAARKVLRDQAIIAALHTGEKPKVVADRYGLTTRQVARVRADFEARPSAMDQRPMEILERVIQTVEQQMASFIAVAEDTIDRAPAVAVGALKGYADALDRYLNLLADAGKLPDNLEVYRSEAELQRVLEGVAEMLQLALAGDMEIGEVIERLRESGPAQLPQTIDGTVTEERAA